MWIYIQQRIRSFGFAWNGIVLLISKHKNAQIQAFLGILAIGLGLFFDIERGEWIAIVLCISLVLSLEAINSCIELLVDKSWNDIHPTAGKIKDMAAGAVLMASLGSVVVGIVIFGKRMFDWIGL